MSHILSRRGSEEGTKSDTHRLVLSISRAGTSRHTYRFRRTFRIRLAGGLYCSKAESTSFAPEPWNDHALSERDFHYLRCPVGHSSPQGHLGLLTRAARPGTLRGSFGVALGTPSASTCGSSVPAFFHSP